MKRHDTPSEVARALIKWAPRNTGSVLDPSVGSGALLTPLLTRLRNKVRRVVAVDRDPEAIKLVRDRFSELPGLCLNLARGDFLRWSPQLELPDSGFDCVVMNPPFDGRTKRAVRVIPSKGDNVSRARSTTIEGAFLLRAVRWTKPGGRVLAVLPGSIISAESGRWIREHLLEVGSILCVHELPVYTFPNVESPVYLFVFEKARNENSIILCNHSLTKPERLVIPRGDLGPEFRLDHGFHEAVQWHSRIRTELPTAGWSPLGTHADIKRGGMIEGRKHARPIHSTAYRNGFWILDSSAPNNRSSVRDPIRATDLLIKRVGRYCAASVGAVVGAPAHSWTDCVLRIRPKNPDHRVRLLFALRTLFASPIGCRLVQRGTGATYVTIAELTGLSVPFNLADLCPESFTSYQAAIRERRFSKMVELEQAANDQFEMR